VPCRASERSPTTEGVLFGAQQESPVMSDAEKAGLPGSTSRSAKTKGDPGSAWSFGSGDSHWMNGHTKPGTGGACGKKILNHVTRNGKREAARDHCVDPNHAAAGVGEWPAGIARRQADIRLNPRLRAEPVDRPNRVDHARREAPTKPRGLPMAMASSPGRNLR